MAVNITFNKRGISLEAKQRVIHSPSEKITYVLDMTPWGIEITGTPTILKVVDILDPTVNLESTLFYSGAASETANNITLPLMQDLTLGKFYRVHVNFSDGTDTYEATFLIECRV